MQAVKDSDYIICLSHERNGGIRMYINENNYADEAEKVILHLKNKINPKNRKKYPHGYYLKDSEFISDGK